MSEELTAEDHLKKLLEKGYEYAYERYGDKCCFYCHGQESIDNAHEAASALDVKAIFSFHHDVDCPYVAAKQFLGEQERIEIYNEANRRWD
jgi:hypothetical protein